jgi:ferredoxin, 2Fe-2S
LIIDELGAVGRVTVEPSGVTIPVRAAESLLEAAQRLNIRWTTVCGGIGDCGACRFELLTSSGDVPPRNRVEADAARRLNLRDDVRLACQFAPRGDMSVRKLGVRFAQAADRLS